MADVLRVCGNCIHWCNGKCADANSLYVGRRVSACDRFESSDHIANDSKKADDAVNHPAHYTQGGIECIEAVKAATTGLNGIEAFCTGNAIKYLFRWKHKNGVEDINKAIWYLERLKNELCGIAVTAEDEEEKAEFVWSATDSHMTDKCQANVCHMTDKCRETDSHMTNGDRIRSMSDESIAEQIFRIAEKQEPNYDCMHCAKYGESCEACSRDDCIHGIAMWLKQEVEKDGTAADSC